MTMRHLCGAALLTCVLGWSAGSTAQLSIQVTNGNGTGLEELSPEIPRSRVLPPAWVYWRRPDGAVSMPCGERPVFPALCETADESFASGVHRLEIVESIGSETHVYQVETNGSESSVRVVLSGGSGTVHLTERARGLVLVPGPSAGSLLLTNRASAPRRVMSVNGAVFATVARFSMVLGWRRIHSADLYGTFEEVTVSPGRSVAISFEYDVSRLRPGLYRAQVGGSGGNLPGGRLEVHTSWVSEDYLFYGTAP